VPTKGPSPYGAADEVAMTGEDQAGITDIVNRYCRPGTAAYVELPGRRTVRTRSAAAAPSASAMWRRRML